MRNIFLFGFIILLASCASREKLIAKTWKFKELQLENSTDSATLAFTNKASEQMQADLNIELAPDSSYTIMQLKEGKGIHGRWWFSTDKKVLLTKTDLGLNQYKVLKLTKKELVYEVADPVNHQLLKMTCVPILRRGSK